MKLAKGALKDLALSLFFDGTERVNLLRFLCFLSNTITGIDSLDR